MDEMNNVNTEQQPTTQPEANSIQGNERMFTQAEVDKIVKDRLARAKTAPKEPTEAEIRERELTAKESRLSCREYLIEQKYPAELLDVIDTSNIEEFKTKADTVSGLLNTRAKAAKTDPPELTEMKRRIGREQLIPDELALRLIGENEADLYRDANVMHGIIRQIKGPAPLFKPEIPIDLTPQGFGNSKHIPKNNAPIGIGSIAKLRFDFD